ncbi:hypothetical protein DFH08DRAFT_947928 [Mycena albidolilacea]|uniref:Uncharacterized protein n=1 Tax=Mycena albidolilacea TaxID=1033008 RepID=A0AAD7AVZ1_9AGAR|nr:hypothetical protein DFH08DRAFT_947928 [Mycena albidolilacea]
MLKLGLIPSTLKAPIQPITKTQSRAYLEEFVDHGEYILKAVDSFVNGSLPAGARRPFLTLGPSLKQHFIARRGFSSSHCIFSSPPFEMAFNSRNLFFIACLVLFNVSMFATGYITTYVRPPSSLESPPFAVSLAKSKSA